MKKLLFTLLIICITISAFGQDGPFTFTGKTRIFTGNAIHWNADQDVSSNLIWRSWSNRYFDFNGTIFKQDGKVGIGTSSPNAKLEINGDFLRLQEPVAGRTLDIHPSTSGQTHRFTSTTTVAGYSFENNAGALMTIAASGKIGVGTTSPGAALDVGAGFTPRGGNTDILIGSTSPQIEFYDTNESGAIIYEDNGLALYTNGSPWVRNLFLKNDGNVGIGTSLPTEKLSVDGTVLAKKVRVSAAGVDWPDYVFTSDYELRTLNKVEDFIKANKHLPEVPSAKQVEANGLDLGNMDATLLKKVEELTLYMIQLNKKVERLEKENQDLKKRIEN